MSTLHTSLQELDRMLDVQLHSTCVGDDTFDYMQGLYNGMEFARSIIAQHAPIFMQPDGALDINEIKSQPERFI